MYLFILWSQVKCEGTVLLCTRSDNVTYTSFNFEIEFIIAILFVFFRWETCSLFLQGFTQFWHRNSAPKTLPLGGIKVDALYIFHHWQQLNMWLSVELWSNTHRHQLHGGQSTPSLQLLIDHFDWNMATNKVKQQANLKKWECHKPCSFSLSGSKITNWIHITLLSSIKPYEIIIFFNLFLK